MRRSPVPHPIPHTTPEQQIISLEPYKPVPVRDHLSWGAGVLAHMERHNPAAKTTAGMTERKSPVESFPLGIYEAFSFRQKAPLLEEPAATLRDPDGTLRTAGDALLC